MEHYAKNIIVDFKETDRYLYLRLDSFLQMLNTVSMYHTVSLGFAPDYMEDNHMAWVLYSWNLHLENGDYYAKKITFKTFAVFNKDIYSHRYFYVLDEKSNVVGYAVAVWIVIDTQRRKMTRIPLKVQNVFIDSLDEKNQSIEKRIIEGISVSPLKKIRNVDYTHERAFPVRFNDIDSNLHVNNTVYVNWAMESLVSAEDEDFLIDHVPSDLSIVYKKEKRAGGKVIVKANLAGLTSYHEIYDEEGCLLSLVELTWKKR